MALTSAGKAPGVSVRGQSAPAWVFALYAVGLALVYLGEHVLSGLPKGAGAFTLLGLLATAASTAVRFSPRFRAGGERRSIESLLALLSVTGLVGLLVYFATSDWGAAKLGLDHMATPTRARFDELARVAWITLIVVAIVPMAFAETALTPMRNAERPESRRVRAAATAGLVLALAGLYCSLFVYAAGGVDLKIDYSYFKTSKPSDSTRNIVKSLSGDPIKVVAFFPDVNEVRKEVATYLRDVASGAPKLTVEIKDRLLVPKLAQELKATQGGVIVFSRGSVNHTLSIGTDIEQARPKLKTLDRDFQEQLVKIARSRHTAYFTTGHGELTDTARPRPEAPERGSQVMRTLLQRQNYLIKDLGLGQGLASDVPEDADLVLIIGPTLPFTQEELAALKRYAQRGGHLLMALDPDSISAEEFVHADEAAPATSGSAAPGKPDAAHAPSSPATADTQSKLASSAVNQDLAALVGLKFNPEVLANEKSHVRLRFNDSDRARIVTNSFSSHASVSTLSRNSSRAAVVLFGSGSLEKAPNSDGRVDFAVRSMPGTFADANRNFTLDSGEKSANFNMGAALSKHILKPNGDDKPKDKKDAKESKSDDLVDFRAFVLADADAFSDFVIGEIPGNQILFVDAVRWLVGEESVQGLPNTEEDVRVEYTKQGDLSWFYATVVGAPLLVFGASIWVSRRSRARGGKR